MATYQDWAQASESFDNIKSFINDKDLSSINEAQTRFDIIDRVIKEFLCWHNGLIIVEDYSKGLKQGYVDYTLILGDTVIIIEAKKTGASFPTPTFKTKLKLNGSILGEGEINSAIRQAEEYAIEKEADVVVVTNGLCWCFYSTINKDDSSYATILFPFQKHGHAEQLFDFFALTKVSLGSLNNITNRPILVENRLISIAKNPNSRVERNSLAEYITPALDNALYSDALLSNPESLNECFVSTESRTKYDNVLRMHLADSKPSVFDENDSAKRIRKDKPDGDAIGRILKMPKATFAPPVTLLIGSVGSGKSTFLKHFELVSGRKLIDAASSHWIYIDFEKLGKAGSPREFLYQELLNYLNGYTDYKNAIEPAYSEEIASLARGPYSLIYNDKEEFKKIIFNDLIKVDYQLKEPYVDKVFKYLSKRDICVIVLDNVDLYEDEQLEKAVFSEGLALSKRINTNVIVSIRDTTFIKHNSNSTFNAYELKKLWISPPPFREVLSRRLSYSKRILEKETGKIVLSNNITLNVSDLSTFFDIVQRSILDGDAGHYIESVCDMNIRKGISLVTNFLTSGHIQADRAIQSYLSGDSKFYFPFHEIFKGTMLGYWRYFREDTTECVNIFDARLGSKKTRLLRLLLLNYLVERASDESTLEVPMRHCLEAFINSGASPEQIISCIDGMAKKGLMRCISSEEINHDSTLVATKAGGYYLKVLSKRFVYIEECMFDTAIEDVDTWQQMSELSRQIENKMSMLDRMVIRKERIILFLSYLKSIEEIILTNTSEVILVVSVANILDSIEQEVNKAIAKIRWREKQ